MTILDEIIAESAEGGIYRILIGMAHRGRLNVLAHILNKPYEQLLAEFKELSELMKRLEVTPDIPGVVPSQYGFR